MFKQDISFEVWGGDNGKYRLRDDKNNPLENTPEETCARVAKSLSDIEASNKECWNEQFKSILGYHFAGGGRIMANVGASSYKKETSPINCIVMKQIPDSMDGIMDIAKEAALILKAGSGIGFDFSTIRPKGSHVFGAGSSTSGIISFMKIFDAICSTIMSGGARRGAQMACLDIYSPEIEEFITEKRKDGSLRYFNCSILAHDAFMQAVEQDKDWSLWFWQKDTKNCQVEADQICFIKKNDIPYNHNEFDYFSFDKDHCEVVYNNCSEKDIFVKKIFKTVKAKYLFDIIMTSTYNFWEPGCLFIDLCNKENNLYFCEIQRACNPCIRGATQIAVADGRNSVSIKQLAEEGKDVPVYSLEKNTGKVSIKMGRNPRVTGTDQKLIRVLLDDGSYLDVTLNHKFILLNGDEVEAKNLKHGDSLPRFTKLLEPVKTGSKDYYRIYCDTLDSSKDKIFEHRLIAKFYYPEEWDYIYNSAKQSGFAKTGGLVIHHKDYNSLNNNPNNLQIMTFRDHTKLHGDIDQVGEKNGRYCGVTSEEIKQHALNLTKKLNRRFSSQEWSDYARENNLPRRLSTFRQNTIGTVEELAMSCAIELKMNYINIDPRIVKTYQNLIKQGYSAKIEDKIVLVKKICEICKIEFYIDHGQKDQAHCSTKCARLSNCANESIKLKQQNAINEFHSTKMLKIKSEQARVYSELKFKLGRRPFMKEWENACKKIGLTARIGQILKFGFKSYKEVSAAGENYNHKVVSVTELDGLHTVYNMTVDDNHTFAVITSNKEKRNNLWYSGIYIKNCGEQNLPPAGSCLLGSMILPSYVKNEFEDSVSFDFDSYIKDIRIASRLLDNVVEINNLPVKAMQDEILCKRRHGLGFTGVGSLFNMMKMSYGSEESLIFLDKLIWVLAKESLLENIELAKEKGCAPIFNSEESRKLVLQSVYLNRLINSLENQDKIREDILKYGLRYSHATSFAPTGTLSLTWGNNCSNGIEPVFADSYLRNVRAPGKKTKIQEEVFDYAFYLWKNKYGNKELPSYWRTTDNINVNDHLKIQATVQKWCDSAVSKTINVPANYSFDKFKNVYMDGWKLGLKGITTYRPNAKISSGVLSKKSDLENTKYSFELEDGSEVTFFGNEYVEYDGEKHNVANLFDALKEGIYGNM